MVRVAADPLQKDGLGRPVVTAGVVDDGQVNMDRHVVGIDGQNPPVVTLGFIQAAGLTVDIGQIEQGPLAAGRPGHIILVKSQGIAPKGVALPGQQREHGQEQQGRRGADPGRQPLEPGQKDQDKAEHRQIEAVLEDRIQRDDRRLHRQGQEKPGDPGGGQGLPPPQPPGGGEQKNDSRQGQAVLPAQDFRHYRQVVFQSLTDGEKEQFKVEPDHRKLGDQVVKRPVVTEMDQVGQGLDMDQLGTGQQRGQEHGDSQPDRGQGEGGKVQQLPLPASPAGEKKALDQEQHQGQHRGVLFGHHRQGSGQQGGAVEEPVRP